MNAQDSSALRTKYLNILRANQISRDEVQAWLDHADKIDPYHGQILGRNFSQLKQLKDLIDKMMCQNEPFITQLSLNDPVKKFLEDAKKAEERRQIVDFVWDYYRDKLELRLTPLFRHSLWAADLVAHDCYSTVMARAQDDLGIQPCSNDDQGQKQHLNREAPLPYLDAIVGGAATYRRHVTPLLFINNRYIFKDTHERNQQLPIALIELSSNIVQNVWELVVLGHEVAHDIDGDLNTLHNDLPMAVETALMDIDAQHRTAWKGWALEVFADLMALRLMGPAYARQSFLGLASDNVLAEDPTYPSNYLRMLLMLNYLDKELGYTKVACDLEGNWRDVYSDLPSDQVMYVGDFEKVIQALMKFPLQALTDKKDKLHTASELATFTKQDGEDIELTRDVLLAVVNDLLPYFDNDDDTLRDQAKAQLSGYVIREIEDIDGSRREILINEPDVPPPARHVVSAAYMAYETLVKKGGDDKDALVRQLRLLNLAGQELVKAKQPAIKLAGEALSEDDEKYLSAQASNLFALFSSAGE